MYVVLQNFVVVNARVWVYIVDSVLAVILLVQAVQLRPCLMHNVLFVMSDFCAYTGFRPDTAAFSHRGTGHCFEHMQRTETMFVNRCFAVFLYNLPAMFSCILFPVVAA